MAKILKRIDIILRSGGPVLTYLSCRPFSLQSFFLFLPKIRGGGGPYLISATVDGRPNRPVEIVLKAAFSNFFGVCFLIQNIDGTLIPTASLLRSRSGRSHVTLPVPTRLLQTDIHSFLGNKPINVWLSFCCECSRL